MSAAGCCISESIKTTVRLFCCHSSPIVDALYWNVSLSSFTGMLWLDATVR